MPISGRFNVLHTPDGVGEAGVIVGPTVEQTRLLREAVLENEILIDKAAGRADLGLLALGFRLLERVGKITQHHRVDLIAYEFDRPRTDGPGAKAFGERGRERSDPRPRIQDTQVSARFRKQARHEPADRCWCHVLAERGASLGVELQRGIDAIEIDGVYKRGIIHPRHRPLPSSKSREIETSHRRWSKNSAADPLAYRSEASWRSATPVRTVRSLPGSSTVHMLFLDRVIAVFPPRSASRQASASLNHRGTYPVRSWR